MAELSTEQEQFLANHRIPLSRVFNATGMRHSAYKAAMGSLGLWVAYGVTPCREKGHTLRTSAGHCAQCKPASLAFRARHDLSGDVYVAHSKYQGITKIGSAVNAVARIDDLNAHGYGQIHTWEIALSRPVERAGAVEFKAQNLIESYRISRSYWKGSNLNECRELFQCTPDIAISAVTRALEMVTGK